MKTTLNLQERLLSELHPADYNPRVALKPGDPEYENIKNSIEAFGYVDPIIVNSDGTIIGGHQRYNVLLDLGVRYHASCCCGCDQGAGESPEHRPE